MTGSSCGRTGTGCNRRSTRGGGVGVGSCLGGDGSDEGRDLGANGGYYTGDCVVGGGGVGSLGIDNRGGGECQEERFELHVD